METAVRRSESPSTNKSKVQEVESVEKVDEVTEQSKAKKKGHRNKQKCQINGKENVTSSISTPKEESDKNNLTNKSEIVDSNKHEEDKHNEEVKRNCSQDNNVNNPFLTSENSVVTTKKGTQEMPSEEKNDLAPNSTSKLEAESDIDGEANVKEKCGNSTETEDCANNLNLEQDDFGQGDKTLVEDIGTVVNDSFSSKSMTDISNVSPISVNGQSATELPSEITEESEIYHNGTDEDSYYEAVDLQKETESKASPDDGVKEDNFFKSNITSLLPKWNTSSPLQSSKQEAEITSSKKIPDFTTKEGRPLIHPYLSKVSGRPGIKSKSNFHSSCTNGTDSQTPPNKRPTLSDSFRVKSDPPPRLMQMDSHENPVLKKYKGKRCLNVNDDYEDGDETFVSSTKRRKLDDKINVKSGFLGSVLWSPFRKRTTPTDESSKLSATQSKISKFLSPFWFWKKIATAENEVN